MTRLAALLCLVASPLAAQDFSVPQGCTPTVTVQSRDCSAYLAWTCDIAPEGDRWEARFSLEGLESIVSYDAENAWLDAVYLWDGSQEEAVGVPADPISMTTLIGTGRDSFEFQMRHVDDAGTQVLTVKGEDNLTGDEIEISGIRLLQTRSQFTMRREDGSEFYRAEGTQYVSPDLRMFFFGPDVVHVDGQAYPGDGTPVEILLPGDPGFGQVTPLYGCNGEDSFAAPDSGAGNTDDKKK